MSKVPGITPVDWPHSRSGGIDMKIIRNSLESKDEA